LLYETDAAFVRTKHERERESSRASDTSNSMFKASLSIALFEHV
jgi:hypothetical protein